MVPRVVAREEVSDGSVEFARATAGSTQQR
jgi:hypothetical protein